MSRFANALKVATTVALMAGVACVGSAQSSADPSADVNTLAASLSKGYSLNNCASQPLTPGVLAQIACNQNPDAGGPAGGQYFLIDSADGLATTFKGFLDQGNFTVANCGDTASPTTWKVQGNPAGQVVCGTVPGQGGVAQITWTTDAKNILSFVRASNSDVGALYKWWLANG
ncbi:serine/threonine protein kinase [Mycolicibacterium sp. Dal123E01]|uniref:serine/threonine protein kinase n=1 Tax=Mycolicibacterium sp. Dal123E01 TaxID=3457578 RepID=UPI00403E501A